MWNSLRDSIKELSKVQDTNDVSAAEKNMQELEEIARINIEKLRLRIIY